MKCFGLFFYILLYNVIKLCDSSQFEELPFATLRKLLSDHKHIVGNRTHNITKDINAIKALADSLKEDESSSGTEAAVLFIVAIVVLSVIGMIIYFFRKFDQLNESLPTYRYSSLKTEINGYGLDDKNESQALVTVSTEEEDDYDEEDEDVFLTIQISPPTLLVQSQTVMSTKPINGIITVPQDNKSIQSVIAAKSGESSLDSDDELLQ